MQPESGSYSGLPAAPGIGIGIVSLYRPGTFVPEGDLRADDPQAEWEAFQRAHHRADRELEELSHSANSLISEIFAAHRVILQDKTLLDAVAAAIFEQEI